MNTDNLNYIIDFLDAKDIKKTLIFSKIKCNENEAKILRYLLNEFLNGTSEIGVLPILQCLFIKQNMNLKDSRNTYLKMLNHIKNLLDSGWICSGSFGGFIRGVDMNELTYLELLNIDISLSQSFFRLLEGEKLESKRKKYEAYKDNLEYLKDQFERIGIIEKISKNPRSSTRLKNELANIDSNILRSLEKSNDIFIEKLLRDSNLNEAERTIFFAILKEEYLGSSDGAYREMNNLVSLISDNEYARIKNYSIFDEQSALISNNLIEYDDYGGMMRTFYIPEHILQKIQNKEPKKQTRKMKLESAIKSQQIFELVEPKNDLEDIILEQKTKEAIMNILKRVEPKVIARLKEWGIKDKHKGIEARILFYGASGTGKTITAQAIAKALKKQILSFDCSKILSMYIGESEKNVRKIFDEYKKISEEIKHEPVLFLDEADQFLSLRAGSGTGAEKMHNQMQNIFLEQIEKFSGILIATTNLVETIDSAFSRRFNYKIEFKRPNEKQRVELWKKYLPKNAIYKDETIESLSTKLARFDLSGAQISLIIKNTAYKIATLDKPIFTINDFEFFVKEELRGNFDGQKSVGF